MTRPLCGLQRSKRNRMSGLSHIAAVLGAGAGAAARSQEPAYDWSRAFFSAWDIDGGADPSSPQTKIGSVPPAST